MLGAIILIIGAVAAGAQFGTGTPVTVDDICYNPANYTNHEFVSAGCGLDD